MKTEASQTRPTVASLSQAGSDEIARDVWVLQRVKSARFRMTKSRRGKFRNG
jgi:hypothetical protein